MYLFSGIFIFIPVMLFILNFPRKKRIIRKISAMPMEEKYFKLNQLAEPFGYHYNNSQDIFTTTIDAWQKDFGYIACYDQIAPRSNLVFDSEPVYFYYDDKTWLIEFWKGQYGINFGCEVGLYYVDHIVPLREIKKTHFEAVSNQDMLPVSINLVLGHNSIARLSMRHWWITIFRMGSFSRPSRLAINISITFPDKEMLDSFVHAMLGIGYQPNDMYISGLQMFFSFDKPYTRRGGLYYRLCRLVSLLESRFFCWIFRIITRPFCLTVDKLLYLYLYLPFAFRRMIRLKRFKKLWTQKGR
jgi:hypothetical protein